MPRQQPRSVTSGPEPRPGAATAWALIVAALLGVSLAAPIGTATAAGGVAVAFWRSCLGALATAPVVLLRRAGRAELAALRGRRLRDAVVAGVVLAAHFALWVPSLKLTSVTSSMALVTAAPIWVVAFLALAGRRPSRAVVAGVLVAVAGALVVTGVDATASPRALLGDAMALGGGIAAAGYTLAGERVRATTSTAVYTLVAYTVCSVVVVPVALLAGEPLAGYAPRTWVELLVLTVAAQLVGHTALNAAVPVVGSTVLSLSLLLEVPGAMLVAWVWLGQTPPVAALPGAVLLLAGLVAVIRAGAPRLTEVTEGEGYVTSAAAAAGRRAD